MEAEVQIAERLAYTFHHGVVDRHGVPYIEHVRWVAEHVDDASRPAGWLHDVIEDTDATVAALSLAGISDVTIAAVLLVTREPQSQMTYMDEMRAIAQAPGESGRRARAVKLADNQHNQHHRGADPQLRGKSNTRYPRAEKILRAAIAQHGERLHPDFA